MTEIWPAAFMRRLIRCVDGESWDVACEALLDAAQKNLALASEDDDVVFYRGYVASLEAALRGSGALDRDLIAASLSAEERLHGVMIDELLDEGVLDG